MASWLNADRVISTTACYFGSLHLFHTIQTTNTISTINYIHHQAEQVPTAPSDSLEDSKRVCLQPEDSIQKLSAEKHIFFSCDITEQCCVQC